MSGMSVNVSVEKLGTIKNYVDEFQNNVKKACLELEGAANQLKQKNSAEDIQDILKTVDDIREIISSADPTFKELQSKIENYIRAINRLKAIANR